MKIQDIGFIVMFTILFILQKDRWFVYAGLISLVIAMPLFAKWVFFTAERLVWYAAAFLFTALIYHVVQGREVK